MLSHFGKFTISVLTLNFIIFLLWGCKNESPVKIGFAGGLTGRHSDLGLYGRNGVLLAVEEANRSGGINGRPIMLIAKDDKQDPETAIRVDQELIAEGVVAIIGHFTSAMSIVAVPVINEAELVMISPTSSANSLSGKDDFFLRLMAPNVNANAKLSNYVFDKMNVQNLVILYDNHNEAFGLDWVNYFSEIGITKGRKVTSVTFTSGPDVSFATIPDKIDMYAPDGILIIASALDAAMICQQIRKKGNNYPIFTTMWSMSDEFLYHGGRAVEGVIFSNWFDPDHPSTTSQTFQKQYIERFGKSPNFSSYFSYETATIVINSLRINDNAKLLKKNILQQGVFSGTQGEIRIDQYGDPMRELFLMTVRDSKFVRVE